MTDGKPRHFRMPELNMKKWSCKVKGKVTLSSLSTTIKLGPVCSLKDLWERLRVEVHYLNAAMEKRGTCCGITAGITSFYKVVLVFFRKAV